MLELRNQLGDTIDGCEAKWLPSGYLFNASNEKCRDHPTISFFMVLVLSIFP